MGRTENRLEAYDSLAFQTVERSPGAIRELLNVKL